MNNGHNDFGVAFSNIMFLEKVLTTHENVRLLYRHDDIVFEINRPIQGDFLTIACVESYSVSLELTERVVATFPETNIIYYGGKWNGVTKEAAEFCEERGIGLFNAGTLSPALRHEDFGTGQALDDQDDSPSSANA